MSPWLAVALGAGVFSAVVNVACNTVAHKRGSARKAAERVHAGRHTALTVAITLEEFAHRCQTAIDRAERRDLSEQPHVQSGDVEIPPFAFSSDTSWRDLDPGKASYLRAFSADQTHSAELIQSNDRCSNVDEFAAYIKGHCAEFGRRAWLMAVELREENELQAVTDHNYVIEFDAALSRYIAWEQRQKVRGERVPSPLPVPQSPHRPRNSGRGLAVGGPA
ncbi:hypothetical protein ABH944_003851 [Caballeronia udeis]|jgi:hypothetical protein|uniref:Lipoprotein n=1 Tax=Caballeronia udeis TaxID=1232866 RepID=A0ABW8MJE2_9BURK